MVLSALLTPGFSRALGAERINHEGRLLGPVPVVTVPTLFHTPEADAIISALQIFPTDSPWNEDVSRRPLHPNSDAMIARIISELLSNRRTLRPFYEMNFVLVPDSQPLVPINLFNYPDESDPGPYPIPSNLPVEGWPRETGSLTLVEWQQDIDDNGGDRHSIIVQPGTGLIWETWLTRLVAGRWDASNGAKFDLQSNVLRPSTWTSADAAGLCMFAGLVRFDECERGIVEHAMRVIVKHTRREFIYPATHFASVPSTTDPDVPAMGQRLRLKAGFTIPDHWRQHEKAVLRGLKKYGALVADNGNFFSISVAPDPRFPDDAFDNLRTLAITNFEIVQTTGPNEGPRSPGAPTAHAGPDLIVSLGTPAFLNGAAATPQSALVRWSLYSGPGEASFADATRASTTASFSALGRYTLLLSADDGVHTVSYDAAIVEVTAGDTIRLGIKRDGEQIRLEWTGGTAPYQVQRVTALPAAGWQTILTTQERTAQVNVENATVFYRIQAQ